MLEIREMEESHGVQHCRSVDSGMSLPRRIFGRDTEVCLDRRKKVKHTPSASAIISSLVFSGVMPEAKTETLSSAVFGSARTSFTYPRTSAAY